jgi:adenine-specific DNA-methyltransferase
MAEQDFIKAGFTVVGTENNENKLLSFLKENYPNVIRDTEINLEELKAVLGLPIDEKVNGYGLNFVGRNFARAKYAQKTEKELRLNSTLSKNIDTTENLVLKGDNLDSLKILKNHYSGQIKCIYIDPPYNTAGDEFVYPDKFDKEEAEVLGLANLSESDFARMDFSFKTKKSHNGWLAFMYPRLLLARDLLSKDGAIFISIDENEQANLKLLCDDVFGEDNFVECITWEKKSSAKGVPPKTMMVNVHEYILVYRKTELFKFIGEKRDEEKDGFKNPDNDPRGPWRESNIKSTTKPIEDAFTITDPNTGREYTNTWAFSEASLMKMIEEGRILWKDTLPKQKEFMNEMTNENKAIKSSWGVFDPQSTTVFLKNLIPEMQFDNPKPINLMTYLLNVAMDRNDCVLDFFAGSGTTGQAVMQLNTDDGGSRKFILCQIDEPIKENKPAYKFCIENNLPPVISSITLERLKRAGEKIVKDVETENSKMGMFEEDQKQVPDIGFKVFDSVEAPKLKVDDKGQISITVNETDALSRIYNMIFTVGLDEPTQVPEEVVKDCIYRIGNNYYITNSEKITGDDFANAIKNGKVFVDGWTASLNGTLQSYKEDVKIVFERYHMETS